MKLHRSSRNRLIGGVCSGLAESVGWSANRVRLVYVLVSVLSAAFPGIVVYLVLWFLMPLDSAESRDEQDTAGARAT